MGERRGRVKLSNKYKGPLDKDKGWGRIQYGKWSVGRAVESNGGKVRTTLIEQQ